MTGAITMPASPCMGCLGNSATRDPTRPLAGGPTLGTLRSRGFNGTGSVNATAPFGSRIDPLPPTR